MPSNASFFDPTVYRVVLLDQRGTGKSTPTCELRENNTQNLVGDIEALRKHLGISKWHVVFGGSWGSTLSLLYAQAHPEVVSSLVLRGIFLFRQSELDWGHPVKGGEAQIHPDVCEEFLKIFTDDEKADWEQVIYKRLTSDDRSVRVKAARDLNTFDFSRGSLLFDPASLAVLDNETWSMQHATILMHYMVNNGFIREGQILEKEQMDRIRHIPCEYAAGVIHTSTNNIQVRSFRDDMIWFVHHKQHGNYTRLGQRLTLSWSLTLVILLL